MFFFFQAEDGIRDGTVTGVQTCALPISCPRPRHVAPPARTTRTARRLNRAYGPVPRCRAAALTRGARPAAEPAPLPPRGRRPTQSTGARAAAARPLAAC